MKNSEIIINTIALEGKSELVDFLLKDELLSFAEWKRKGYKVNKGQKAVLKAPLWKKVKKKEVKEGEKDHYFVTRETSLFTSKQVSPIKEAKKV